MQCFRSMKADFNIYGVSATGSTFRDSFGPVAVLTEATVWVDGGRVGE